MARELHFEVYLRIVYGCIICLSPFCYSFPWYGWVSVGSCFMLSQQMDLDLLSRVWCLARNETLSDRARSICRRECHEAVVPKLFIDSLHTC